MKQFCLSGRFASLLFIVLSMQLINVVLCRELDNENNDASKFGNNNNNRRAVMTWAKSLTELDHNATHWSLTMRKQPQNFFYHYAKVLTEIFTENHAIINFVLVGACDGTNDNTISDHYFPNNNWQGLFVEPVSYNYKDLQQYLAVNHAKDRSFTINAAVTDVCDAKNVTFKVSVREEKDPNAAHWLRRQIGSIVSDTEKLNPDKWRAETVRCASPLEIVTDWGSHLAKLADKDNLRRRPRIHVLKIDAEGHDYKVLNGFMMDDFLDNELPLIISYEAKSMGDNLEVIRQRLAERGYVNSFGTTNDGFSLLRSDFILKAMGRKGKRASDAQQREGANPERKQKSRKGKSQNKRGVGHKKKSKEFDNKDI